MDSLVNYSLIVNEISLKNNNLRNGQFEANINLRRNIDKKDDSHYFVTLILTVTNDVEHPFPVDLKVSISGLFDVSKLKEKDIQDFVDIQTCQLLLPHVRSIIASLTASAMIPPLLIPIVDARKLFND